MQSKEVHNEVMLTGSVRKKYLRQETKIKQRIYLAGLPLDLSSANDVFIISEKMFNKTQADWKKHAFFHQVMTKSKS